MFIILVIIFKDNIILLIMAGAATTTAMTEVMITLFTVVTNSWRKQPYPSSLDRLCK